MENLRQIGGGDDSFLDEIVQMFREDTPPRLDELDECMAKGDAVRLGKVAHGLKGAASNFGAKHFRTLAEQLEHAGKNGNLAAGPAACAALRSEFTRILAALAEYRKAR